MLRGCVNQEVESGAGWLLTCVCRAIWRKGPRNWGKEYGKGGTEGHTGHLPQPPGDRRQVRLSKTVSSSIGVITAALATELSPTSLPRNLVLVYYEVWLLQSPVALLQLPERACGGVQGLGRESCSVGRPAGSWDPAPPRLPRQDKLERDPMGLLSHLGPAFLESWEKKEQRSRKANEGEPARSSSRTRMHWTLVCSTRCPGIRETWAGSESSGEIYVLQTLCLAQVTCPMSVIAYDT